MASAGGFNFILLNKVKEEAHIRLPLSVFNYFSCIQMAIGRIFDLLTVNLNYQPYF